MQRRPFPCTGFRQGERAGIEAEGCECASAIGGLSLLAPVQAAGDHQMEDEPAIVVEAEGDTLAHTAQAGHGAPLNRFDGRVGGAQERRPANLSILEHVAEDALRKRFHVNDDVRKFRHTYYLVASLQTDYRDWKWLDLSALRQ